MILLHNLLTLSKRKQMEAGKGLITSSIDRTVCVWQDFVYNKPTVSKLLRFTDPPGSFASLGNSLLVASLSRVALVPLCTEVLFPLFIFF